MRVPALTNIAPPRTSLFFPDCCNNSTAGPRIECYRNRSERRGKVVTMSHPTRLLVFTAALLLAGSSAHAFTFGDQTTTNGSGAQSRSFGSTLMDPGSEIRNYSGVDLPTPKTTTTQPDGFTFK